MSYKPKVNDYVVWNKTGGIVIEGWVYFFSDEYITIEIGTRDKTEEQIINGSHHRKDHILVVCSNLYWNQLNYIKTREPIHNVSSQLSKT